MSDRRLSALTESREHARATVADLALMAERRADDADLEQQLAQARAELASLDKRIELYHLAREAEARNSAADSAAARERAAEEARREISTVSVELDETLAKLIDQIEAAGPLLAKATELADRRRRAWLRGCRAVLPATPAAARWINNIEGQSADHSAIVTAVVGATVRAGIGCGVGPMLDPFIRVSEPSAAFDASMTAAFHSAEQVRSRYMRLLAQAADFQEGAA